MSLDVQTDECEAWATENGHTFETFVDAGYSGRTADRPALQDALAGLEHADVLVVWKVDRLARDNVDRGIILRECERRQVAFVSVTQPEVGGDSPEAQLVGNIVGAVAEFESQMIGARIRAAQKRRRLDGELPQKIPYGYDKEWEPIASQARVIGRIDRHYLDGWGTAKIAGHLNATGIASPAGGVWWTGVVRGILRRSIYSGTLTWGLRRSIPGGSSRPATEPPITTEVDITRIRTPETYGRIMGQMERRSTATGYDGRPKHPFVTVLVHQPCGTNMVVKTWTRKSDQAHRVVYYCNANRSGACPSNGRIYEDAIVAILESWTTGLVGDATVTRGGEDAQPITAELDEVRVARRRIVDAYTAGAVTLEELTRHRDAHDRREAILEQRLEQVGDSHEVSVAELLQKLPADRERLRGWVLETIERIDWDGATLHVDWRL